MDESPTERLWCDGIELRASTPESKGPGMLAGYAMKWDSLSAPLKGKFREMFTAGSFTRSLGLTDSLAVVAHDEGAGTVVGRTSSGTLRLAEDASGLRFENDLPDTTSGRDLAVQVARGDIRGVSVAFVPHQVAWDHARSDLPVRVVSEASLHHLSYEARPAYRDTSVALRSLDEALASRPDGQALTPDPPPATEPEAKPSLPLPLSLARARLQLAEADS